MKYLFTPETFVTVVIDSVTVTALFLAIFRVTLPCSDMYGVELFGYVTIGNTLLLPRRGASLVVLF